MSYTTDPLPPTSVKNASQAVRQDVLNQTTTYYALAIPGVLSTESGWQIQKITYSNGNVTRVEWANGNNKTDKIWDSGRFATITGITQANPGSVTAANHGFATGSTVIIRNVSGMTQVNNQQYTVTSTGTNTFTIGVDTTAYSAYVSGGTASQPEYVNAYTYS